MIELIINNLDFILGYVLGCIVCFIVELLCIASDKKELNKWMEKDNGK